MRDNEPFELVIQNREIQRQSVIQATSYVFKRAPRKRGMLMRDHKTIDGFNYLY